MDEAHARQVMRISEMLFDEPAISQMHMLGGSERDILSAAAGMHDVGISMSVKGHHKHSLEMISKMEVPGFSKEEIAIMANVARYHRKGHPSDDHPAFERLSKADQNIVRKLASLLRIADGLDRMHDSSVVKLHCKARKGEVELTVESTGLVIEEIVYSKASLFVETYMTGFLLRLA